jgi:sodium transport system permease protein
MTLLTVRTILFKELLDTFRDKRTLVAMIGVPILLYPALFIGATQAALVQQSRMEKQVARVALRGTGAAEIGAWLKNEKGLELVPDAGDGGLGDGTLDAIVEAQGDVEAVLLQGGRAEILIRYDTAEPRSREARARLQDAFQHTRERLVAERVKAAGLLETFAQPLKVNERNVAPAAKSTGSMLGTVLPLIMVVMLGVGAFYPAVDLTAGEKERGTFETLLSTPATKLDIVAGKFLAVFSLSMLTGTLNLASMLATFAFQLAQIFNAQAGDEARRVVIEIPPQSALVILAVLVPLAFFISALMMTVALMARSFREAQNYVSPFFLAIVLPAGAAAVPSVQLDRVTQFIPITNVTLLFRDLLMGKSSGEMAFFVFVSTAVYALLALLVAVWMFQREDVVLSQESVAPITLDRRSLSPSDVPAPGIALAIFGMVMLLIFYAGTTLQMWRLHLGLVLTQYLLILVPVLFALWFGKVKWRTALNLRLPSAPAAAGSTLIGAAWVVISIQLGAYLQRVFTTPEELETLSRKLFDLSGLPGGVWTLLAIVALSPAICEEALFRGVLLSALKPRLPGWATVAIIGLLFGMFHLSVYKVVSTGLTGALFAYLVLRSGSIVCSSIAHILLNGLAILVETGTLPGDLAQRLKDMNIEHNGLPIAWVVAAAGVLAAGAGIMEWDAHRRKGSTVPTRFGWTDE